MSTRGVRLLVAAFVSALLAGAALPAVVHADACTPPVANAIACENSKPGVPEEDWQIDGAGDPSIQGYATAISVNRGETISFKIKSSSPNFTIDILRVGYYGGDGARLIQGGLTPSGTSSQPACQTFPDTGLIDCGNWAVTRSWTVPANAVSGIYLALLKRSDGARSHIVFVVRDPGSQSDIVVQTSDQTWQAYNDYGGNSLYICSVDCPPGNPRAYKAALKVSYNRPFVTANSEHGLNWIFGGSEYPLIRFLEANGYDVSYISSLDVERYGTALLDHKLFISSGHDEYWTATQRSNLEAARDAKVNLAFFTGNEMFWKTRWEPSAAGPATPDRTLVSYKDTHFDEPTDPVSWTGTWYDLRFSSPGDGLIPQNALTGQTFTINSGSAPMTVPARFKSVRFWRNTDVEDLTTNQSLTLAPNTVGYEWDEDADNGYRPAGQFRLSETTVSNVERFTDYGSTTQHGQTATHHMTMYRAASGALVFGSGTVQWSWGLDDANPDDNAADVNMQQATVNLFADMGAQPATLASGLVPASESTDTTAPTSTITSYPSSVADGAKVTISGTAADAGGGVVAGVEISTDGGQSWHAAQGTTSWSHSWIAHGNPAASIKVRAVDDSGNLETPGTGVSVAVTCPCSIWGINTAVAEADRDQGDPTPVEVGVKFKADKFGSVSGVRFYKASANTGTHIGSLWTEDGERLAQATFSNESPSGWQTVSFSSPVLIEPGKTYVASYFAPNGHYSGTPDYFHRGPAPGPTGRAVTVSPPLRAVLNTGGETNGVYTYGPLSAFPTNSYGATNYWVDVVFTPEPAPGAVSNVTATSGGLTSANVSWTAPSSGGAVTGYKITPYIGSTAQTPMVVSGSPPNTMATVTGLTNGTTYTFRVQAINPNGDGPLSPPTGPVTPLVPVAPSAPRDVSAEPGSQSAQVRWHVPEADGDAAITGYSITPYRGATPLAPVQTGPSARSKVVTGLTNGTEYAFRVTAHNDAGTSVEVSSEAVVPQATLLGFDTPANVDYGDPLAVELGVKFKPQHDGWITGIRYYRGPGNTGTHVGSLWSADGTRLAQTTFINETGDGWQSASFQTPVAVTAGTTYIASYYAPNGRYSVTSGGLAAGVNSPPLSALADSESRNGVYAYGSSSTFPTDTWEAANYWVDVLYALPVPGQVTDLAAEPGGSTSARLSWTAPTSGGPVTGYRITPYVGSVAQPSTVIDDDASTEARVSDLTTGTTYTFRVEALNANGAGAPSAASDAVTPQGPVVPSAPKNVTAMPASGSARVTWAEPASDGDSAVTGYVVTPYLGSTPLDEVEVDAGTTSVVVPGLANGSDYRFRVRASNAVGTGAASAPSPITRPEMTIFDFATPTTADAGDTAPLTLGVKFRTEFDGSITGIRFYKSSANTGTHLGTLWSAQGTRLAEATFTDETATGWQYVRFANPVPIVAGETYVASYFAPNGGYSVTSGGLLGTVENGPLRTLANAASSNGVFSYWPGNSFPTSSYNASNYWVDVTFQPAPAPTEPTGVVATSGTLSATVSWAAPAGGGPVTEYTVTPYVAGVAQESTAITGSPPATSATIAGLTPGTPYTFRVTASNPGGSSPASSPSAAVTPTAATVPSAPTSVTAVADTESAIVEWSAPADDGGNAITGYAVTPYLGAAAQTPVEVGGNVTRARVTGLDNGAEYSFRVAAVNGVGAGAASAPTDAVRIKHSLFGLDVPGTPDAGDNAAVVLGVKFQPDVDGVVTGLRFYKAAANTGTHVGGLWSSGGSLLTNATFSGETSSGWQTVTFASPVVVTAGTTYVASYHAPNGHYSTTSGGLASAFVNPPLRALADSVSGNGVYRYSATPVFPDQTWNATNYWVDVLFEAEPQS